MPRLNTKIGILGYGEIGKALEELYKHSCFGQPVIKDLDRNEFTEMLDVLNVCIPYSEDFVNIVVEEIQSSKPLLTIIHSTIAPGSTRKIISMVDEKFKVAHSPVRGIHPNLVKGLKTFTKYVGTESKEVADSVMKHFKLVGMWRTKRLSTSLTTELNKLIDTTYYGLCIAFTNYIDKVLEKNKVSFKSFEDYNETYNSGFRRLKMRKVNRPTLYAPKGKIGGHCIVKNCEILQKELDDELLQSILKLK